MYEFWYIVVDKLVLSKEGCLNYLVNLIGIIS